MTQVISDKNEMQTHEQVAMPRHEQEYIDECTYSCLKNKQSLTMSQQPY